MSPFTITRRVEFAETDMAGIVHFANFYKWMEETEHEFFRVNGLSIMERQPDGTYIGWPRVSASCSFQKPAHYADLLEVRLDVERVGAKSVTYLIEFWKSGERIAHGRVKTACCICRPDGTLSSIELPERYRQVLDPEGDVSLVERETL